MHEFTANNFKRSSFSLACSSTSQNEKRISNQRQVKDSSLWCHKGHWYLSHVSQQSISSSRRLNRQQDPVRLQRLWDEWRNYCSLVWGDEIWASDENMTSSVHQSTEPTQNSTWSWWRGCGFPSASSHRAACFCKDGQIWSHVSMTPLERSKSSVVRPTWRR